MNVTTAGATIAPTTGLSVLFQDNETTIIMRDNDKDSSDGSPLPWILFVTILIGCWCLAVLVSTKGCRDWKYRETRPGPLTADADDPVWATMTPTSTARRQRTADDYRLALELQRQEAAMAAAQAAQARVEWIDQLFLEQELELLEQQEQTQQDLEQATNTPLHNMITVTERNISDYHAQPSCPICLSEYIVGDVLRQGALCTHVFHQPCIRGALGRSKYCPVCRQVFLVQELDGHERDSKDNDNHQADEENSNNQQDGSSSLASAANIHDNHDNQDNEEAQVNGNTTTVH